MKKQAIKVNAILKVNELESSDEGVFLNEEQIHSIDAQVTVLENSVSTITGERDAALTAQKTTEQSLTAEQAIVAERDATIAAQTTQIENLKKGAGAKTTNVVTDTDNNGGKGNENDDMTMFASTKELYDMLP